MKTRDFFYMSKSDRRVLISLLCAGVIIIAAIMLLGSEDVYDDETISHDYKINAVGQKKQANSVKHRSQAEYYSQEPVVKPELFEFDPNTADSTALLRLGLKPWQVRNIYKYRARGGIYRQSSDFAKLYGLTVKQYRELEPYIRISTDYQPASLLVKGECDTLHIRRSVKLSEGETIDLNLSDTTALKTVPGIGGYFSRRIVQYRERLGGFVRISQLDEIDDFPEISKKFFRIDSTHVKKLNINRLPEKELRKHPYINYYIARDIADYRRLHGNIRDIQELSLSPDITQDVIDRLRPYVEY